MTEPRPWREGTDEVDPRVAHLVTLAASVPPRPLDRATWDDVLARAAAPRHPWRLVPAFVLSVLAGVALVLVLRPAPSTAPVSVVARAAPVVTPSPGAAFTQDTAERIALRSGRLVIETPAGVAVHLQTPHVELEAQRGRFLAEVTDSGTRVLVEEGEVVLRTPDGARVLRAGDSAVWPPTPEIPSALLAEPLEAAPSCADAQQPQKLDCLAREASRDGLEAQAALYELGMLELRAGDAAGAEAAFRESLTRFPGGVLHPEVRLALLVELVRERRFADAREVARGFEASCGDDPRADDVATLRRALERLGAAPR